MNLRLVVIEFDRTRATWIGREVLNPNQSQSGEGCYAGPVFDLTDWERAQLIRTEAILNGLVIYWQVLV